MVRYISNLVSRIFASSLHPLARSLTAGTKSPNPGSIVCRLFKFSGNVLIYAVVGTNGIPDQVQIDRPAGMGLDEQAVRSVQQYKFRPATIDGTPIRTDLFIEVNFQIF